MLAAFVLAVTLAGAPGGPGSLRASIDSMRQQVQLNQDLEDEQRKLLEARLAAVDLALVRFEQAVAHCPAFLR